MSEAYECDRCGSLNSGTPHTLLVVGNGVTRFGDQDKWKENTQHLREPGEIGDEYYDVCPGCRSAFEAWWDDD